MKNIIVLIIATIFMSSFFLIAQNKDTNAKVDSTIGALTSKLQQKILLSDLQTKNIKDTIIQWLNDKKDLGTASIQTKIEGFLGNREKAKYSIIQKGWWSELIKALDSLSTNKKLSGQ
ncbi:MAG: hypothetical protein ACYC6P_00485 [Ignavibacteriaceae bacterium]|jgi:hypothetical protein